MEYRQHQLDNGLTLLAECNPRAYAAAFGVFVKAGSRDESEDIGGVSHFLEHMVFKGTPNRSAEAVNRQLDAMGSHSNARTGEDSTIYHATVLPDFQTDVVELLADLMRPSLRTEDFETEKKVIVEEIMMYDDQPPYGGHERLMRNYFGQHSLGNSILGTVESVTGLTPQRMLEYFQQRYSPGNMAIAASGNVDFDRLIEDAEKHCGKWESFNAPRTFEPVHARTGFDVMVKSSSTQQYIMQLGNGPATDEQDRYAAHVLSMIMGDDSGSRMFWNFIDTGLAESAGVGVYEFQKAGVVMSYLCCSPEQAQKNINLLYDMQVELADEGVSERELDLAKRKIAARIILRSERSENRMFRLGGEWLHDHEYETIREIAGHYDAVTLDDVNAVAKKYHLAQNMTLCVGPMESLHPATEHVAG
jgi:predicted Zn-dependent peptidase